MSKDGAVLAGCCLGVWQLFIALPLWWTLLYQIMTAAEVSSWVWIIFFGYIPVQLVGLLLAAFMRVVEEL